MPSLNETLGTLPSGRVVPLSDDAMTRYLREQYIENDIERQRKKDALVRLDLVKGRGKKHFLAMIDKLFKNSKVRQWRQDLLDYAMFQNVTQRIIREISAVYSEPATRSIDGKQANERYRDLQMNIRMDRRMRLLNRRVNLLNESLIWPDVVDGVVTLRVVTPNMFCAVADRNDPLKPVAYIIDQKPLAGEAWGVTETSPHYLVMSDSEFFKLDRNGRMVQGSRIPHTLGQLPALLVHREEPDEFLLDGASGNDLVSGQMAVALLNVMMLKHQKSGVKTTVATGDTSTMARSQPLDEDTVIEAPEGVNFTTLDLAARPGTYIDAVQNVIKQLAANHGIPMSVFDMSYQATSGFEIELKRTGLREIRRDQIVDYRHVERELADLMSRLLRAANHESAFDTKKWRIEFGEVENPTEPLSRLTYWEKLEQMDLANRVEMMLTLNPGMSEQDALAAVQQNAKMRKTRAMAMGAPSMPAPLRVLPGEPDEDEAKDERATA